MRIFIAAILASAIATPVAAHSSKTSDTVVIKKHHAHAAYAAVPMARRAAQDVYVDGVYVGSDPDWRVRETLRQENRGGDKL
jgi:hypothetical protein